MIEKEFKYLLCVRAKSTGSYYCSCNYSKETCYCAHIFITDPNIFKTNLPVAIVRGRPKNVKGV